MGVESNHRLRESLVLYKSFNTRWAGAIYSHRPSFTLVLLNQRFNVHVIFIKGWSTVDFEGTFLQANLRAVRCGGQMR